jgi:MFS family permease
MHVFANAQFHLVVYTLFLLDKGFSTQQFFLIESGYSLVALLMEVPTGMLSDRRPTQNVGGRKWSLVVASLVGLPVVPTIILSNSFWVVLVAMSVGGISSAFVSGTDVAMLYDTLVALGREDEFTRQTGRMQWLASLSMAVSGAAGGFLARWDLSYAWWAYLGGQVLTLLARLTLIEPPFHTARDKEPSYLQHLGQSLRTAFGSGTSYFVLYAAAIGLFFSLGFWLWQPYLKHIAFPVSAFGLLYAAMNVLGGLVSKQAHRVEAWIGMRRALLFIPLLLAAAFILESQVSLVWGFSLIGLQTLAGGAFSPLLETYVNQRISSARRATVLSIVNMLRSVLFMTLSPLLGYAVDAYSLPVALLMMGVALGVAATGFALVYGRWGGARTSERAHAERI